ncbi:MAG: hypothetical protein J6A28_03900 [Clostridia bacterium]|nr:hypothetical protein [Clostridia bacterium]
MAQKTTEQLVEEILELKARLKASETSAQASKAITSWAKKLGYEASFTEKATAEHYEKFLDTILANELEKLQAKIETLELNLQNETKAVEELLEGREQYDKDIVAVNDALNALTVRFADTMQRLKDMQDLYEKTANALKYETAAKNSAISFARKHKKTMKECEAFVADCLAEIKKLKKEKEYVIGNARQLKNENEQLRGKASELRKAKSDADKKIAEMVQEIAEQSATIEKLSIEAARAGQLSDDIVNGQLYAQVVVLITKIFKSHGYQVASYAHDETNTEKTNRQNQLYIAIKQAKQADIKAEKNAKRKKTSVIYPEYGYKMIRQEILKAFELLSTYYSQDTLDEFKKTFANAQNKWGETVTSAEIVDTILKEEPNAKFINTKAGKAVLVVVIAAAVAAIGTIVGLSVKNANTQKELDELKENPIIVDTLDQCIQGDLVTLPVDNAAVVEDFMQYRRVFLTDDVAVVKALKELKYNKATGEVEIVIEVVTPNKLVGDKHIKFNMDMAQMDSSIREGTDLLDAATIFAAMKETMELGGNKVDTQLFINQNQEQQPEVEQPNVEEPSTDAPVVEEPKDETQVQDPATKDPAQEQDPTTQGGDTTTQKPVEAPAPEIKTSYEIIEKKTSYAVVCKVTITTTDEKGNKVVTEEISNPVVYKNAISRDVAVERAMNMFLEELERDMGIDLE